MPEFTFIERAERELSSRRKKSLFMDQVEQELISRQEEPTFMEQAEQELSRRPLSLYQQQQIAQEKARKEAELEHARRELAESPLPNVKAFAAEAGSDLIALGARLVGQGETADRYTRFGEAIEQAARERDERSIVPAILSRGVRGAARSLTTMAPAAAVGGPYAAISLASAQETNRAITKGKDKGLKGVELAEYVIAEGVIEGAPAAVMQKMGLGGMESMLSKRIIGTGVRDIFKKLGIALAQELPEEWFTEIGHDIASAVYLEEEITPESLWQTVKDTGVQTVLAIGMAGSPSVARSAEAGVIAKKTARVAGEMETYAKENKVPSRKTWRKWGLAPKLGETRKQRRAVVQQLDELLQIRDAVATEAPEAAITPVEPEGIPTPLVAPEGVVEPVADPSAVQEDQIEPTAELPPTPAVEQGVIPPTEVAPALEPDVREGEAAPADPALHDMQVETVGTRERVSAYEIVRKLEKMWDVPIRAGRMGVRKARGIYKRKAHVVRLAKGEESSPAVAAHEVAHHLDDTMDVVRVFARPITEELQALDYDQGPTGRRKSEGFAEFIRGYTTGSTFHIDNFDPYVNAPEFTRYFEKFLSDNPEIKAKIETTKGLMTQWRQAGVTGRVGGQIERRAGKLAREVKEKLSDIAAAPRKEITQLWDWLYTRAKMEGRPIERYTKEGLKRGYAPGEGTTPIEEYMVHLRAATHYTANALEYGVFRLSDNKRIGPSMVEVLAEIEEGTDRDNFATWAYARTAVESWKKGKNPGITKFDAEETVKQLYNPRYERAANKLTKFLDATIDVLVDSGAIEEAEATQIKEYYKYYLPLRRAGKEKFPTAGRRMVDLSSVIKGRIGGGEQIIDPLESAIEMTVERYERAAKQLVIERVFDVAETKDMGEWAEILPEKVTKTLFKAEAIKPQLKKALEEGGVLEEDVDVILDAIDPTTLMTIWKPDLLKVRGEPVFRVTREGKPKLLWLHPELGESLGGLAELHNLDAATKVVKEFNKIMKWGATRANPSFVLATNPIKDLQVFLMQGEKGLKGVVDPFKWATLYAMAEYQHMKGKVGNPVVELFNQMGGPLSTYLGTDQNRIQQGVLHALRGQQTRVATILNTLSTSEVASRVAEFAAVLEKHGWLTRTERGEMPPRSVLVKAMNAAHDVTTDFRRMGKWGRKLNLWIPFINAQAEGFDKTIRTFRDHPERTLLRVAMQRVPLALMYWWYKHDDDDYKERSWWLDSFYTFLNEKTGELTSIPKPHEWGLIDSGIERLMDALYFKDPEAIKRWGTQFAKTALPNIHPAGVTPVVETTFNWSLFRHRPVESQRLQKLQPPERYYEHTSELAKATSTFLHKFSKGKISLSPAKIDYLSQGLTGGLYRRVTAPVEQIIEGAEWRLSDVPGLKGVVKRSEYPKSRDDFYSEGEELSQLHESNKLKVEKGEKPEPEDLDRWRRFQNATILMTSMQKAAQALSVEERKSTELAMVGLARAVLEREPLKRYPNPIVSVKTLPDDVKKEVEKHIAQKAITISTSSKTKKSRQAAKDAATYLRALGVTGATVQRVAYARLRAQGMQVGSANKRKQRIRIYLP